MLQELIETEQSGSDSIYAYRVFDNEDILLELDGSNNITARYTHGPGIDEPLIMEKGGVSLFYSADGLGSITEITNQAGSVVQRYTYSSFGKIESQLDPNFIQPYTFTAREFDLETGLHYYRARYYDPSTGRFLEEDPVRFLGGANFYAYAHGNPVVVTDAFGLWSPGGHDAIFQHVFRDKLTPQEIQILQQASRDFDRATQSAVREKGVGSLFLDSRVTCAVREKGVGSLFLDSRVTCAIEAVSCRAALDFRLVDWLITC